jgi:hypothetical protein
VRAIADQRGHRLRQVVQVEDEILQARRRERPDDPFDERDTRDRQGRLGADERQRAQARGQPGCQQERWKHRLDVMAWVRVIEAVSHGSRQPRGAGQAGERRLANVGAEDHHLVGTAQAARHD